VTNLGAIDEALAGLTDIKLRAIVIASNESPRMASSLLAWIESA